MKLSRSIIALVCALLVSPAFAQTNQGSSPLTGYQGGTNNAFMQFTGPAGSMKTYSLPNASDTICTLNAPQGFTAAKTFSDLTLLLAGSSSGTTTLKASATASGTLTLPAATDTLLGRATTDTLTNKTFDTAAGNILKINGLAVTDNTGTGKVVRDTSPTLVTPTLGAATATSINKVAITAPASGATLTIPDGVTVTAPAATDTLVGRTSTDTLTNKAIDTASNTFKLNGAAFGTASQATAALLPCVGDAGTGGVQGLVPAPGAGDAAAQKFLRADCTFAVPPGGGGGGGMTDVERQNAALTLIYQSKALAGYRRVINQFAAGFKSSDGINAGSSSNYTVDTTNGFVAPSVAGGSTGTFGAAHTSAISLAVGGVSAFHGFQFTAPATSTITQVKINIQTLTTSGTVTASLYTDNAGHPGTLVGSSTPALSVSSTGDKTLVFGSPPSMTNGTLYWIVLSAGGSLSSTIDNVAPTAGYKSGRASSISAISPDDYGGAQTIRLGIDYGTGVNNMTLVTASQTSDASVSNGRVLLEFDNTASPTLNSDLTVEVTCNGGVNWEPAVLTAVTSNSQGGRKVAETADTACTAGTSFAARIKTLNNKNVPIYGLSVTAH